LIEKHRELLKIKQSQLREAQAKLKERLQRDWFNSGGPNKALAGKCLDNQSIRPDPAAVEEFWGNLLGVEGQCNKHQESVQRWRTSMTEVPRTPSPGFDLDLWQRILRKVQAWKAPGRDGIHGFWWKAFPQFSAKVGEVLWQLTKEPEKIPLWLVQGRTVLIPKEGCTGSPEHYKPITCLNTQYKILTAVLSEVLLQHVTNNRILPMQQRALLRAHRGCQDALLIDRMVVEDAQVHKQSLSVGWIDYTKAYDRVPHQWIKLVLKSIRAPRMVTRTIRSLIPLWKTTFELGKGEDQVTFEVKLKRGLFQGDSLSPLLFCLCIAPISSMLNPAAGYHCLHVEEPLTHILYMDDLKLFTRDKDALEDMMKVVDEGSQAIGMSLGLRKCGVAHMTSGKRKFRGSLTLEGQRQVRKMENGETYKYLGIAQVFAPGTITVKQKLMRKFLGRLRAIWRSSLSTRQVCEHQHVGYCCVPLLLSYHPVGTNRVESAGYHSAQEPLKIPGSPQPVVRLYIYRSNGGRGLTSLRHAWE